MITKPMLPPRSGYVERVNDSGEHYYAPTQETRRKLEETERRQLIQKDMDALTVDHEYRLTLLELGVI